MSQIDEIIRSAQKTKDLSGQNLSKAKLSGMDLSGYDLSGADLSRSKLNGTNLSGTKLDGVDLSRSSLKKVDLSGAKGKDVNLRGSVLEAVKAVGLELDQPELSGVAIKEGEYSGLKLRQPKADGAQIQKVTIKGLELEGGKFSELVMGRVRLEELHATGLELSRCRLNDTTFVDCRVEQGSWTKSDLSLCRFEQTTFDKLDLTRSDLSGSVFKNSTLRDCKLERAVFLATDWQDSSISGGEIKGANFKYARGFKPEQEQKLREGGAKVSRHLVKRSLSWMLKTHLGRISFVLLVLALIAASSWVRNNPDFWHYEQISMVANQELNMNDLEEAGELYRIILDKYEGIPDYTNPAHLGLAQIAAKRNDEAELNRQIAFILDAPAINPEIQEQAWMVKVDFHIERREYDMALEQLSNVPWGNNGSEGFYSNILEKKIQIYSSQGRLDLAEQQIVEFLEQVDPESDIVWRTKLKLGEIYDELGREEEALLVFRAVADNAIQIDNAFQAYERMATIYHKQGRIDLERQIRDEIFERFPEQSVQLIQNKIQLASLAFDEGREDEARQILEEVIANQLTPDYSIFSSLEALASWDAQKGNYDKAREYYQRSLDREPKGEQLLGVYLGMADLERRAGENEAAEGYYKRALREDFGPNEQSMILYSYGNLMASMGMYKPAERRFKEAQEKSRGQNNEGITSSIQVSLARIYRNMGRYDEALDVLNGMISDDTSPADLELRTQIAQIHRDAGENKKSLEVLDQTAEKYKDETNGWISSQIEICELLIEMNKNDRVKKIVNELIDDHYRDLGPQLNRLMGVMTTLSMNDELLRLATRIASDDQMDMMVKVEAVRKLAQVKRDGGNVDEAIELLMDVLDSSGDDEVSMSIAQDLANLYNEIGRLDDAITLLEDTLEQKMSTYNKVMLTILLAQFYSDRNDLKKAIDVIEDLKSDCEDWTSNECLPALEILGRNYEQAGDESKSKRYYQIIVDNFSDSGFVDEAKRHL
ncbi:MAG: tetratricopeptide repeat protein [Candidatus Alcyoniella australis]|nr:tetratricopeptide repeat protein [Candidatus Alcyoniella australis]